MLTVSSVWQPVKPKTNQNAPSSSSSPLQSVAAVEAAESSAQASLLALAAAPPPPSDAPDNPADPAAAADDDDGAAAAAAPAAAAAEQPTALTSASAATSEAWDVRMQKLNEASDGIQHGLWFDRHARRVGGNAIVDNRGGRHRRSRNNRKNVARPSPARARSRPSS